MGPWRPPSLPSRYTVFNKLFVYVFICYLNTNEIHMAEEMQSIH